MRRVLAIALLLATTGSASATFSPVDRSLTDFVPVDTPIGTTEAVSQRETAYFNAPQPAYGQIFQCRPRDMVFFTGLIRYARACD
ncbi:MAG TPA: hypothetical protein VFX37_12875 [Pseudolabrys sp.]|nr:hypothetical protein [Pseudolabrys sp.]